MKYKGRELKEYEGVMIMDTKLYKRGYPPHFGFVLDKEGFWNRDKECRWIPLKELTEKFRFHNYHG